MTGVPAANSDIFGLGCVFARVPRLLLVRNTQKTRPQTPRPTGGPGAAAVPEPVQVVGSGSIPASGGDFLGLVLGIDVTLGALP